MAQKKKAASDAILSVLKRGPRKGLTAVTISDRSSVKLSTTRTTLSALASAGNVTIVGTVAPEGVGRPANLYALAA